MCDNSSSRGTLSETNAGHFVAKFLYDGRGRMALEQRILGGTAYQLSYGYDALDRLTSAVYPNGDVLAYRYGDHGQTADLLVNIAPLVSGASRSALLKVASLFFEARYHDATIGQFVQRDSTAPDPRRPFTLNRYAYGLNNSLKYVDPDGRDPKGWFSDSWKQEFRDNHNGADPTTNDYAYRYVSVYVASNHGGMHGFTFNIPPGVSLGDNIHEAESHHGSGLGLVRGGSWLSWKVFPSQSWDYKTIFQSDGYEGFGNFNFGAAAAAVGLTEEFTLRAAGAAQWDQWFIGDVKTLGSNAGGIIQGKPNRSVVPAPPPQAPWKGAPYGDDPPGRFWTAPGYEFYQDAKADGDL